MTSLTSHWPTIGVLLCHPLLKFATVRILVTCGTSLVGKMKWKNAIGSIGEPDLVTIRAGDRYVSARERELRLLVHGDGERRVVEVTDGVAAFAPVFVGFFCKLSVVDVLMAVRACFEFHFVNCVFAGGGMAFGALHLNVLPLQRIR
jgi:hypothetical protein